MQALRSRRWRQFLMALQAFLRSKTSRKWAPFRVRATAPIQPHYRVAFAFSDILYPHLQQRSLRSACHCLTDQWRRFGLTEFHNCHKDGLGPACSPVTQCQRAPRCKRDNQSRTILVEACQQLRLHAVDGVYQQFTCVGHTNQPSVSPACCSQDLHGASRRPHTTNFMGLHCQDASHNAVTSDALSLGYFWLNKRSRIPSALQLLVETMTAMACVLQIGAGQLFGHDFPYLPCFFTSKQAQYEIPLFDPHRGRSRYLSDYARILSILRMPEIRALSPGFRGF